MKISILIIALICLTEAASSLNSNNYCNLKHNCIQTRNCVRPICSGPYSYACGQERCAVNHLECKSYLEMYQRLFDNQFGFFTLRNQYKRNKLIRSFLLFKNNIKVCHLESKIKLDSSRTFFFSNQ